MPTQYNPQRQNRPYRRDHSRPHRQDSSAAHVQRNTDETKAAANTGYRRNNYNQNRRPRNPHQVTMSRVTFLSALFVIVFLSIASFVAGYSLAPIHQNRLHTTESDKS